MGSLAVLVLASSCQTVSDGIAPGARAFRDFEAPFDDVWEACAATVRDLPILEMDRSSGRIATDWYDPSRQGSALEPATEWHGRREVVDQERLWLRLRPMDEATRVNVTLSRQGYTRDAGMSEGDQLDSVTWSLAMPSARARRILTAIADEMGER